MQKDLKKIKALKELKAFNKKYNISVTVDENMEDFSNDPYFVAKNEKAAKFLAEHGVPESFKKKSKSLKAKSKKSKLKA